MRWSCSRTPWMLFVAAAVAVAFGAARQGFSQEPKRRPNIVVIMADDLGYGDVSCNGARTIQTPHIDRLAAEGLRFTSGYCSASTCTPTRYSLMTGVYAFRVPGTGVAAPNSAALIQPGTETLPAILKRAGYATAVIGKWHLGLGEKAPDWNGLLQPGPLEVGFDHCLLLPTTNDRVPQVFVENHRVRNLDPADPLWVGSDKPSDDHPTGVSHRDSLRMNWSKGHNQTIHNGIGRIGFYTGGHKARFRDEDLGDEWVRASNRWIEENRDRPFFLFFSSHDIHVPRMPHERFQGRTSLGFRGDSIVEFDWCVGELMKTLDRLQLAENTLVVLCSDNGPVLDDGYQDGAVEKLGDHKPAGPFSGGKYTVLEGGTRTPFITRWKGRVAPGVSDQMVSTVDLAASFASLTGQKPAAGGCRDSQDVLGALLGEPNARGRDHVLQQDNNGAKFGLRVGDWKLVRTKAAGGAKNGPGKNAPGKKNTTKPADASPTARPAFQESLYNLSDDPGEKNDVAARHPDVLRRLGEQLERLIQ